MWQLRALFLAVLLCCNYAKADSLSSTRPFGENATVFVMFSACANLVTNQFLLLYSEFELSQIFYNLYSSDGTAVEQGSTLPIATLTAQAPVCCYNNQEQEYLVTYIDGETSFPGFAILSKDIAVVLDSIAIDDTVVSNGTVSCAYNSKNNEYIIAWVRTNGKVGFTVIDAQGETVVPVTQITGSNVTLSGSPSAYVSYNSVANQYLLSWQQEGTPDRAAFAVYNADGTQSVAPRLITTAGCDVAGVRSSYNSTTNQYLLTWGDGSNNGYFVLYDAAQNEWGATTTFATNVVTSNVLNVYSSYSPQNNEYFVSWTGTDNGSHFALYDAQGNVSVADTTIPNAGAFGNSSSVTSAYNPVAGTFLITWLGAAHHYDGEYAVYTRTPEVSSPLNVTAQRLFNRFANYGNYFNRIQWTPSSADNVVAYTLYRGGVYINTVGYNQTLYDDNNQPNRITGYGVVAVNEDGLQSLPSITYV